MCAAGKAAARTTNHMITAVAAALPQETRIHASTEKQQHIDRHPYPELYRPSQPQSSLERATVGICAVSHGLCVCMCSLTHKHTHTLSLSLSHSLTHSLTLALALSLSVSLPLSLSVSLSLSLSLSLSVYI